MSLILARWNDNLRGFLMCFCVVSCVVPQSVWNADDGTLFLFFFLWAAAPKEIDDDVSLIQHEAFILPCVRLSVPL